MTDVELDARVSALEDNAGVNVNGKVLSKLSFYKTCITQPIKKRYQFGFGLRFLLAFFFGAKFKQWKTFFGS